jgi:guanyl-specific ribonuclease Sa
LGCEESELNRVLESKVKAGVGKEGLVSVAKEISRIRGSRHALDKSRDNLHSVQMQMRMSEATTAGAQALQTAALALTAASAQQSPQQLMKSGRQLTMMSERIEQSQDLLNEVSEMVEDGNDGGPDDDSTDAIVTRALDYGAACEGTLLPAAPRSSAVAHSAARAVSIKTEKT